MLIAASQQNVVVILVIALAVFLLIRQIYRLATGKVTRCSCCSQICPPREQEDGQCSTACDEKNVPEEKDEQPSRNDMV